MLAARSRPASSGRLVSLLALTGACLALFEPLGLAQSADTGVGGPTILIGAGDVASCHSRGDERTARLLDHITGTIFTLGDNAYPAGSRLDFAECFAPSWGRHKDRIRPAAGNHDYGDGGAGYHDYFGDAAGPRGKGYYRYEAGDWDVLVLNSTLEDDAFAEQLEWLADELDLARHDCTLAYWHHPLFSSGQHHRHEDVRKLWRLLYAHGAELVLNGHDHDYERFPPLDPDGRPDPARLREFVVGTGGGGEERELGSQAPYSEVRAPHAEGLLRLDLDRHGYRWRFIPADGTKFTDSGSGTCTPLAR